jgi:hypothetical protein
MAVNMWGTLVLIRISTLMKLRSVKAKIWKKMGDTSLPSAQEIDYSARPGIYIARIFKAKPLCVARGNRCDQVNSTS